jgi:hypothetical protein
MAELYEINANLTSEVPIPLEVITYVAGPLEKIGGD